MSYTRIFLICLILCGAAISATAEEVRPGVFRTPDERFENLKKYPFAPTMQGNDRSHLNEFHFGRFHQNTLRTQA
jgi:hypothetical protein